MSKGIYLKIGNVVRIDSKDDTLRGQYRITSKNINWSTGGMACTFNLNKKPIKLVDYI